MKQKTVYQTDSEGLYAYESFAHELPLAPGHYNVPYGAYEELPPDAPQGMVQRMTKAGWVLEEDYRDARVWIVTTGKPYTFRDAIEIEGQSASYPGWGPLPLWLTTDEPETEPTDA